MAKNIWTTKFWRDAGERALATVAQTWVAIVTGVIGGEMTGVVDVATIPWVGVIVTGLLAGALSILKAVGAGRKTGTPAVGRDPDKVKPQGAEQNMSGNV